MGVPEFLKFVARSAPAALCRTPRADDAGDALYFDYILVDATNVAQTVGLDAVVRFLTSSSVVARRAIVFALDSGRDRSGTTRQHRQTHLMVNDLQVSIQQMCVRLQAQYDERRCRFTGGGLSGSTTPASCNTAPPCDETLVLMSGRNVTGEADYKILDLQRHILATALASQATASALSDTLPTFLLVSEDSDLLCGALCGPAPQTVSIATTLHDTLFDLSILRLSHVLAHVARCVDALHSFDAVESQETPLPLTSGVSVTSAGTEHTATMTSASAASETVVGEPVNEVTDIVRRRRQDGPMVATGVRIALTDSSDDDDYDNNNNNKAQASKAERNASATAEQPLPLKLCDTAFAHTAGAITQASVVDLVFLFVLVLGNGADVPPLLPGVTKVDIAACWQAYCERKYDTTTRRTPPTASERQLGQALVDVVDSKTATSASSPRHEECATVTLNCEFLHAILSVVHCADHQSRAPGEEDRARATALLSAAMYATFRYIVGCNLTSGAALRDSFLDGRMLSEARASMATAPSLAAVLLLLQRESRMTFNYPLHGLLRPEELWRSTEGPLSAEKSPASIVTSSRLQLDVCASLTRPAAAAAWAVRGAQEVSLYNVLERCYKLPRAAHDVVAGGMTGRARLSVGGLVRYCVSATQSLRAATGGGTSDSAANASSCDVFCALVATWRQSVVRAVPQLCAIAQDTRTIGVGTAGAHLPVPVEETHDAGMAHAARSNDNHFIYSFELRRMAPVLRSKAHVANDKSKPAMHSTGNKTQSALLQSVLGLSYDYASASTPSATCDAAPQRVHRVERLMKRPRSATRLDSGAVVPPSSSSLARPRRSSTPMGVVAEENGVGKKKRPGKTQRLRYSKQKRKADMATHTTTLTEKKTE